MPQIMDSQQTKLSDQKTLFYILLILALVRGIMYASFIPPWQAPDEPAQFERAKAALTTAEWIGQENDPDWYYELRDSLFTFRWPDYNFAVIDYDQDKPLGTYIALYQEVYEGNYSGRLPYVIMGLPTLLVQNFSIELQLYIVRLGTVVMGVAIIALAYQITKLIFPNNLFLMFGVPILILFNPQHTHLLSTVNNGNLAELLVTLWFLLTVIGFKKGFSPLILISLLIIGLFAMWTKATAYFLVGPFIILGGLIAWQYRTNWKKFRGLAVVGTIVLAIILIDTFLTHYFVPVRLSLLFSKAWSFLTSGQYYLHPSVLPTIFRSFWAMPGWLTVQLDPIWYQIIFGTCLIALIGWGLAIFSKQNNIFKNNRKELLQILLIFGVAILSAIAIQVGWHVLTGTLEYRHGRSLYPVIVPISIFLLLGWQRVIPVNWDLSSLLILTTILFLFDLMVLFSYIIPFFYSGQLT